MAPTLYCAFEYPSQKFASNNNFRFPKQIGSCCLLFTLIYISTNGYSFNLAYICHSILSSITTCTVLIIVFSILEYDYFAIPMHWLYATVLHHYQYYYKVVGASCKMYILEIVDQIYIFISFAVHLTSKIIALTPPTTSTIGRGPTTNTVIVYFYILHVFIDFFFNIFASTSSAHVHKTHYFVLLYA